MRDLSIGPGSSCEAICENLSAQHDGEQLALAESVIHQHLQTCENCKDYRDALPRIHHRLRLEFEQSCDVDRLWAKIEQSINDEQSLDTTSESKSARSGFGLPMRWLASLSLAASLMIGVVGTSVLMSVPQVSHSAVVTEVVRDFEAFALRGEILDVTEASGVTTLNWIAARVEFELPPELRVAAGYQIAGGRLCSFLGRKLAFIQYQQQDTELSIYVMDAAGLEFPASGYVFGQTTDGLTTVAWQQHDLGFVAIADLSPQQIRVLLADS